MGAPPVLRLSDDGKISAQLVSAINLFFEAIADKLNGFISMGGGGHRSWSGNIDGEYIEVTFPNVADTEMRIPHSLKRLPIGVVVVRKDNYCDVRDGSANTWGREYLYLKCSVAGAVVRLWVF